MLICREYKNCKDGSGCVHIKPHTMEDVYIHEEDSCTNNPCRCMWAQQNGKDSIFCMDYFIVLMEKAIDR